MKFGQAMSIFEAALPEELAAPVSGHPHQAAGRRAAHAGGDGPQGARRQSRAAVATASSPPSTTRPTASASIGQVHQAVWSDGRDRRGQGAVPGGRPGPDLRPRPDLPARPALRRDRPRHGHEAAAGRAAGAGVEELDYRLEAESQHAFAVAYADDDDFVVPDVVAQAETVLVTEWIEGEPLSRSSSTAPTAAARRPRHQVPPLPVLRPRPRGPAARRPAPGQLPRDGRRPARCRSTTAPSRTCPTGCRRRSAGCCGGRSTATRDRARGAARGGFRKPGEQARCRRSLVDYLSPFIEPAEVERFRFDRDWMRGQFTRINDPRQENWSVGLKLNLPPDYLLVHRVWLGGLGVLCQLGAEVPMRCRAGARGCPASPQTRDARAPTPQT